MIKIVITGVSSFIGMHLGLYLKECGYNVVGTISHDLGYYNGLRKKRLEKLQQLDIELKTLDLTDTEALISFVNQEKPSYCIHHAGWAEKYTSLDYDLKLALEVNVLPLKNLYKALSENKCKGLLITGSSAEYGLGNNALLESDQCFPVTPYGLAKLCETLYAQQLSLYYGLATRVVRVFIPYGLYDNQEKLIPSVIQALKKGERIDLTSCEQRRDFIAIDDLVRGYLRLITNLETTKIFDIFNLSSGQAVSLKELLLLIVDSLHLDRSLLNFGVKPMRDGEVMVSYGDNAKALKNLNWQPRSLVEGIRKYIGELDE